jgi:hypothetical protein
MLAATKNRPDAALSHLPRHTGELAAVPAMAQQIEPRAYSNVPMGVNFVVAGYGWAQGAVLMDPSIPVSDFTARVNTLVAGYARSLRVGSQSGSISVVVPWGTIDASGVIPSGERSVTRTGFADPALRLSVNLLGAPAMNVREFAGWRQDTIVGASLTVQAPWGEYDPQRAVNVGTNRWLVKPELGASRRFDDFTLDGALGVTVFGDNEQFYPGNARKQQEPVVSAQLHAIWEFRPGTWLSLSATRYGGGRTTVDGVERNDLQHNSRWGATLALPLDRRNSLKFSASTGAVTRTGTNFDALGVAWQYRFGGGL